MKLKLYVAGRSPNSLRALANLDAICREFLAPDGFELEVIDVLSNPLRALEDAILVTPTLVKATAPDVRIIGDLSERERVLLALGLEGKRG